MTPHQQEVYQRLYDGYSAEKALYERLRQLADEQFELLSQGLQEKAAGVVQEKGRVIGEVGEIEQDLGPVRQQWSEIREALSGEAEQRLADLVAELKELIQSILERDGESEVLLKHLTEETAEQMRQVHQGREAAQAYRSQELAAGSADPCLFDRKE